ncbi:uncharacterized protein LOC122040925 isoform X2 [Zingiber officinale]|uniref:uncharacterized protein LOC122040925 isoform X2 n=1 Tax=Zingiber officinale TaxID=94328 RepID=UPI001C4CC089|nr:uncharacterized protein LOC122040925 isoform X2 [Zingiber officinale]
MNLWLSHPPVIPSIQPSILLRYSVTDLGGPRNQRRKRGRRRRIPIGPFVRAVALGRAALSLAGKFFWPLGADPPDLLLLLEGDGGGASGGRKGFWEDSWWFGGWGRRRRRSGNGVMELILFATLAAMIGSVPEKKLTARMLLLGFSKKGVLNREAGLVALAFMVCFLAWNRLRRRRDGRLKWIRGSCTHVQTPFFLLFCGADSSKPQEEFG